MKNTSKNSHKNYFDKLLVHMKCNRSHLKCVTCILNMSWYEYLIVDSDYWNRCHIISDKCNTAAVYNLLREQTFWNFWSVFEVFKLRNIDILVTHRGRIFYFKLSYFSTLKVLQNTNIIIGITVGIIIKYYEVKSKT